MHNEPTSAQVTCLATVQELASGLLKSLAELSVVWDHLQYGGAGNAEASAEAQPRSNDRFCALADDLNYATIVVRALTSSIQERV